MRTRQCVSGFTLISMLVGLVVGLLSIAAMLVLYRTLVNTSYQVNQQATMDGQIAASSLASQEQLQQAGFGVTSAMPGSDLVLLSGASLTNGKLSGNAAATYTTTVSGNAVVWGYNPSGATTKIKPENYLCEGLLVTKDGLQWLSPVSCTNASQWQTLAWQSYQLAPNTSVGNTSSLQVSPATCWPYGETVAISSLQVRYYLKPQNGATDDTATASAQWDAIPVFSVCLPNFNL